MIKITSKLSKNERARLYRAAEKHEAEITPSTDKAFIKLDEKNCYAPVTELSYGMSEHDIARHMMAVAGKTFDYEII